MKIRHHLRGTILDITPRPETCVGERNTQYWVVYDDQTCAYTLYPKTNWEPVPEERWEEVSFLIDHDGRSLALRDDIGSLVAELPSHFRWRWDKSDARVRYGRLIIERKVSQ